METRSSLIFSRDGVLKQVDDFAPETTVLDYLRLTERSVGTKEGCCEGDCGACTVTLKKTIDGVTNIQAVNSCIMPLGALDGCDLTTVDDLAKDGELHPVQSAMVEHHASQCGFCTPGFVMALYTLYQSTDGPVDRTTVTNALAGNLCRCTGYRPIIDAALAACETPRTGDTLNPLSNDLAAETQKPLFVGDENRFFAAPTSLETFADLSAAHPDATIVAGATDVGLWITKALKTLNKIIYVGKVDGFRSITRDETGITVMAGASYSDCEETLATLDPDIAELVRRIGSKQVRNAGTVGGNIANGSPIGDMPAILIALQATLTLRLGNFVRNINLEDFFIEYGKQDLKPGEIVQSIHLPATAANRHIRTFKLSKRFDQDISAVMMGLCLTEDDGHIAEARVAFGGMAGTPMRARALEAMLSGQPLDDLNTLHSKISDALRDDFTPLSDMRASAEYRMSAACGLVVKALAEIANTKEQTRLIGIRERKAS